MRIAFVADVHLANHRRFGGETIAGLNARARMVVDSLSLARDAARDSAFVVLGDLFDSDDPSPQIVAAAQRALGGGSIVLTGNHDLASFEPGDHAASPLDPVAVVADSPRLVVRGDAWLALVPYLDGRSDEVVLKALDEIVPKRRPSGAQVIACFHAGIRDATTPGYLAGAKDSIDSARLLEYLETRNIRAAVAGNWHQHRVWKGAKAEIVQVGALCPAGFQDHSPIAALGRVEDSYGKVVFYDLDARRFEFCQMSGPRFYTAVGVDEVEAIREWASISPHPLVFVSFKVDPSDYDEAMSVLASLKDGEKIVDGVVEIDREAQRSAAGKAARAARRRETLDEALAAYVERACEPEIAEVVLERARRYLK